MTNTSNQPPEILISFDPELEATDEASIVVVEDRRLAISGTTDARRALTEVVLDARARGFPVSFEVIGDQVSRVRLPHVSPVQGLDRGEEETVVSLYSSHAQLLLTDSGDAAWGELLESSVEDGRPLVVTVDDGAVILDVRAAPDGVGERYRSPDTDVGGGGFWASFWRWITTTCAFPFGLWRSMSPSAAQSLFNHLAGQVCNPTNPSSTCIPFNYPDDGCWGRAHEMCRLAIRRGARPRKTWITGSLRVDTDNNPNCLVRWGWHVAPTMCVRGRGFFGFFRIEAKVFDPALFTTPVSRGVWKAKQNDPSATLENLAWEIFHKWGSATPGGPYSRLDPNFTGTNTVLATYRSQLAARSASVGPPPYPC